MTLVTGVLLVVLPVAFNTLFALLARLFEYPDVLRHPTSDVLARFRAGGTRLLVTWWAFALSAVVFAPAVVLVGSTLEEANPTLVAVGTTVGVLAAVVQFLGLIRWPFLVPYLAREAHSATPARAEAIDVVFQSLNRFLGVAVGEHLGYLLTGTWSVLVGVAMLQGAMFPTWLGIAGLTIGTVLALCSLEFVGPFESDGWRLAGAVTPIAYVLWSAWLLVSGLVLIVGAVMGSR